MSFIDKLKVHSNKISSTLYSNLMEYANNHLIGTSDTLDVESKNSRYYFLCLFLYDKLLVYADKYLDEDTKTYLNLNIYEIKSYADIIKELCQEIDLVDFRNKTGYSLEEISYAGISQFKFWQGDLVPTIVSNKTNSVKGKALIYTSLSPQTKRGLSENLVNIGFNEEDDKKVIFKEIRNSIVKTSNDLNISTFNNQSISITKSSRDGLYSVLLYLIANNYDIIGYDYNSFGMSSLISLIVKDTFGGNSEIETAMLVCYSNKSFINLDNDVLNACTKFGALRKNVVRINNILLALQYAYQMYKKAR